jgi:enoyl-CoA hydratase
LADIPDGLEHLHYEERDRVALITFDRPSVHNAVGFATMGEIERVLGHLEQAAHLGAAVLTGAGDRTFVSGGDLKEFEEITTHAAAAAMSRRMQILMNRMSRLPIPVIGAINGDSFGGGCEVALACDIRVASRKARFAFKQVTIGITPAWGGRQRLVNLVGRSVALRLLLSGEVVNAKEALRLGLVDMVVEPPKVLESALELAGSIAANPLPAVHAIKRQVDDGESLQGGEAIEFEADSFARTWVSEAHQQALARWKQRRSQQPSGGRSGGKHG